MHCGYYVAARMHFKYVFNIFLDIKVHCIVNRAQFQTQHTAYGFALVINSQLIKLMYNVA